MVLYVSFSAIFFTVVYFLSLNPSKLVDHIGKILTPILLGIIAIMATKAILSPGTFAEPVGDYKEIPFFKGFLEGFNVRCNRCSRTINNRCKCNSSKRYTREEIYRKIYNHLRKHRCSILNNCLLLTRLYQTSNGNLGQFENGGQLLATVMYHFFGTSGNVLLSIAIIFACLTTAIGVVSAFANYFATVLTNVSYKSLYYTFVSLAS